MVLLPTQNPDGREADTRRNAYGFDLNRDWFARTQRETDGKLQPLRRYPPVLFIDAAHEMSRETFFAQRRPHLPRDHRRVGRLDQQPVRRGHGRRVFTRQGIPFFNRDDVYDLFYMGYGDTVPSTGFIAAGMTFEKASGDPTPRRVYEQYLTQWVSLSWGAANRDDILARWHAAWVEADAQGRPGCWSPTRSSTPATSWSPRCPSGRCGTTCAPTT